MEETHVKGLFITNVNLDGTPVDIPVYLSRTIGYEITYVRNPERAVVFMDYESAVEVLNSAEVIWHSKGNILVVAEVVYNKMEHQEYWSNRNKVAHLKALLEGDWSASVIDMKAKVATLEKQLNDGEYAMGTVTLLDIQKLLTYTLLQVKHSMPAVGD